MCLVECTGLLAACGTTTLLLVRMRHWKFLPVTNNSSISTISHSEFVTDMCKGNVKVMLSLSTRWRRAEELEVFLHSLLNSALNENEWSTSCRHPFTPSKDPHTHSIGGCVGSRADLSILKTRKMSCSSRYSNLRSSSPQLDCIPINLHDSILLHILKQRGMKEFTNFITPRKTENYFIVTLTLYRFYIT